MANLSIIQQEMIRYGMSIYFSLGLVGNICSCIMFIQPVYRRTPSSIYFLSLSIFSIIYLLWTIVPLFYTLNHIDPHTQSSFYCKIQLYGTHVLNQCIRYIVVFACADRFFVTQTNLRIRSLNSRQVAMKLVFIIFPVSLVIAIHVPILMNISGNVCGRFGLYKLIYAIYQIIIISILPLILMSIFGILTIRSLYQRHVNQVRAKQRDRDFMHLTIAEVIVHVFTSIPYSIYLIYNAITYSIVIENSPRDEIEEFIFFVTQFITYLTSVVSFYVFISTSKPFRNEFINLFVKCLNKYRLRRIVPLNEQNNHRLNPNRQ
ncbi:unnamed protein product [Adineta steineri]|uniref:G-protein coupled receptors family 1 profile domain-containing protein n=1 Tax=Adineta steineri TaxID=433720 RepID=A0A814WLC2_9BILA|nr:unnamed protein product [Adineta steineri]CAF3899203.1 unnamed protein product [Adineta steineri]